MFQTIPTGIRTSKAHGGLVLLESFHFEAGDLTVRVFAPGSGDGAEMRFSDVVGFSMREDLFGPPARPEGLDEPARRDTGFFQATEAGAMAATTRRAPEMGAHKQYRLSLREHQLSFVAGPDYEIKLGADAPAN